MSVEQTVRGHDLEDVLTSTDDLDVGPDGMLLIGGCSARRLVERYGSPLYVVSEHTLRSNYRRIYRAFADRWPRDVNVLYALKANNNLAIRAILSQEGAGGDCFGEGEFYATFLGGADPRKVVLNGSNKADAELKAAIELGVAVNIDAEDEIERLRVIAAELGRDVRVSLRLKLWPSTLNDCEWDHALTKSGELAASVAGTQWGYSIDAVAGMIPHVRQTPGLVLEGYHLHMGRASRQPGFHGAWAAALADAVIDLRNRTGYVPAILDVGGGYARERDPESQTLTRNPHTIEEYAEVVTSELRNELERGEVPLPELWLEPGRFVVGNAVVLLGTVGSIKRDLGRVWVNVDISVNNLMRIETRHTCHHVLAASRLLDTSREVVNVVGSLCTGAPIATNRPLPPFQRGDLVAVLDAGMYAETVSTQLNGVPRPATVLVNGGSVELIKERESVFDVFAKHRIPPRLRLPQRDEMRATAHSDEPPPALRRDRDPGPGVRRP